MRAIDQASIRAYVARDWRAARREKREYWRERIRRGGLTEAVLITDELHRWMAETNPGWPTTTQRDEDLQTHQRVAEALAKTPARTSARTGLRARARRVR